MLVHHKCTVTIEENTFLQCFAATQAASAIWLANSISACIHIIIPKSWRANCLRNRTALQKRIFLNCHCTFVVHQHGCQHAEVYENIAEVQTVYIHIYIYFHVAKKLTCLVPYHSKKHWWVYCSTCLWNLNASKVVFYIQQDVKMEQFVLVLFRPALEYWITVFHASLLCIMQQLGEGLPRSLAVQLTYRCTCSRGDSRILAQGVPWLN